MNPNFNGAQSSDQEPDTSDTNEGSEAEINFSTQDYPELEGLKVGAPVKVTCDAKVSDASNGEVTLAIDPGSCEFQTEGAADKAMKEMSQQSDQGPSQGSQGAGEDF